PAGDADKTPDAAQPVELTPVGMPELKPLAPETPMEPVAKGDASAAAPAAKVEEPKPEPPKTDSGEAQEVKRDEPKPEANAGEPVPDPAKNGEPKAEAAGEANGETAPPKIEGEEAKPARPFNRILRRFFSPAGK